MLKRVENASLFCIFRDVHIIYDDGKTFPQGDPRIRRFARRKRKKIGVMAKFSIGLTIGNYTSVVPAIDPDKTRTIQITNEWSPIDEVLKNHAIDLLNLSIYDKAKLEPIKLIHNGTTLSEVYWLFDDKFYKDLENLNADEVKALILTRNRMRKARIDRAKTIASTPETPVEGLRRGFISEDVKLLIWERDGGKCAKCGARNELQFDHIIPFSLGGSSTADNLQVLCGSCNRAKSNSIA